MTDLSRLAHLAAAAAIASLLASSPGSLAFAEPGSYRERAYRNVTTEAEAPTSSSRGYGLESVLGREVRTRVEEDVGRIIDLLADRHGRVQAAVIEFGGFLGIGTRKIAVEWTALRFEQDGRKPVVIVELTRDQLRVAPEYKPSEPAIVRRASE